MNSVNGAVLDTADVAKNVDQLAKSWAVQKVTLQ
jgi:hypothetical protein